MPQSIPVPTSEVFAMMPSSPILKGQCSMIGVVLSLMPCLTLQYVMKLLVVSIPSLHVYLYHHLWSISTGMHTFHIGQE
jgi:hypothetical protein